MSFDVRECFEHLNYNPLIVNYQFVKLKVSVWKGQKQFGKLNLKIVTNWFDPFR